MRNLKKILALVLALVMSFSLMATANAFTDDANVDATYDEAVTVLSNLKVFQGYEDGSFQPKGSITRAEVAAIIYRIATGDVTDSQVGIYADYNKFSDVKSTSWYAGYVNYCANAEYIKGYDAKTFGPNDPVTGYQALAMILRAVGYDKNGEFTGSNWQVQTASVGKQLHITDKVSAGTLGSAATREVVAEILFRSILVPQVTYTPALGYQSIGVATNSNIWTGWFVDNASIGAETFGLAMTEGEITAVGRTAGTTTFGNWNTTSTSPWNSTTAFNASEVTVTNTNTPWTSIGYQAYVYTVPTAGAKTRAAVSDVVITGDSLGVSTDGTGYTALTTSGNTKFLASVDAAGGYNLYYNGVLAATWNGTAWTVVNTTANAAFNAAIAAGQRGVKIDLVDNDNSGRAEAVVVTEYTAAIVNGIATDTTTTGANAVAANTYYFSGVPAAASKLVSSDTLAMNDVITYVVYNSDFYVTKSASATGTLTKVTAVNGLDTTFTVGGVDYTKSAISGLTTDALNRGNVGRSLVVYTDPYGYAIYAYVSTYADYLYVYANQPINTTTGVVSAKVVMEDGSVSTVNVSSMNSVPFSKNYWNENWIGTDALANVIYGYTVNTDGTYNLIGVTQDTIYVPYTKGSTTWGQAGVDNASVVVDIRQMTANTTTNPVYTGKDNIPSMVNVELVYVKATADNDIDVGFLTAGKADDKTEIFVYQTANTSFTYDWTTNTGYASMDCVLNGVKVSGLELTRAQYEKIMQYGVGIYTYEGDELVFSSFNEEWGTVTWNNGTVWFKGESASYGEVDFAVLDISKGTATTFSLLNSGIDGVNNQRAIVRRDATGKISDVYFIVGTAANATGVTGARTETQDKWGTTYTYAVKPGYITMLTEVGETLSFYGQDALTAANNTLTVSYAEAVAFYEDNGYALNAGGFDGVDVVINNAPVYDWNTIQPNMDGAIYYATVYRQDNKTVYKLIQSPARPDAQLLKDGTEATYVDLTLPQAWTLASYIQQFNISDGATVEWTFTLRDGKTFTVNGDADGNYDYSNVPAGVTTTEISEVKVTVTAENGTDSNTYTNVPNEVERAIAALAQYEEINAANVNDARDAVDAAKDVLDQAGGKNAALEDAIAHVENMIKAYNDQVAEDDQAAKEEAREAFENALEQAVTALEANTEDALVAAQAALTGAMASEDLVYEGNDEAYANTLLAQIVEAIEALQTTPEPTEEEKLAAEVKTAIEDAKKYSSENGIKNSDDLVAAETAAKKLDDLMARTDITKGQYDAMDKVDDALDTAIANYKAAAKDLADYQDAAKAKLAEIYNALEPSERYDVDGDGAYQDALNNIYGAATKEAVDTALANGIAALLAYDADATNNNLAGTLVDADLPLNDTVGAMLGKELSLTDIRTALWDAKNIGMAYVIPALLANDVSVGDIFTEYKKATTITAITQVLAGVEGLTTQDIMEGFFAYYEDAKTGTITGLDVKFDAGTMTFNIVPSEEALVAIKGTGFGELLSGLTDGTIDWTSTNLKTEKSYNHTNAVGELKKDILAVCGKLDEGNWTVDVKIDGEVVISFYIHAAE